MIYRQICPVNNNQIVVPLPHDFKNKKQVTVIVDDQIETDSQKLEQLKQAMNDPLFLSDIKEIQLDFSSIDHETL